MTAPGATTYVLPASSAQERLWFLQQLEPDLPVYNVNTFHPVPGRVDPRLVESALATVVERHEALRTALAVEDGKLVQVVAEEVPVRVAHTDLAGAPAQRREAALHRVAVADAAEPIALDRAPLWRARLVRLADEDWRLVFVVHHAVFDATSGAVFQDELLEAYAALATGRAPRLPELPIQYADFAAWQARRLADGELDGQLAYWRAKLADAPELLQLPADRPRPKVLSYAGADYEFAFPRGLSENLDALARRAGATPFMTVLAGFAALVSRFTGERDVVVGTPVAGRDAPETASVIGMFVNTVNVRVDLRGDPTIAELIDRVRTTTLEALDHAELPFERLVEALQPERDQGRTPLHQVGFNLVPLQNRSQFGNGTSKLDLQLDITHGEDGLRGWVEYSTALFDADRIERLVESLMVLLRGAVEDPDARVSALPLMGADELERVAGWNATGVAYRAGCLGDVVTGSQGLRLGELRAPVGVLLERGEELVGAVHAVVAAGGAYVPLEPEYPDERLAFMVRDAGVEVVVTSRELSDRVPAGVDALYVEDAERGPLEWVPVDADALAYVMFTSGSTGRPKGVGVSHRAIVNRLLWMQDAFGLDRSDRVLFKTPFSFDVSVWELFWPAMAGAGMVIARPGGHRDSAYLADLIAARGVTTVHFVPSMLDVFVDEPRARPAGLRRVICSGEALSAELCERFFARFPGVELHNLYGPTEAAVDVSWHVCRRGEGRVPIGRPIASTRLEVLDEGMRRLPVGVPGELYLGGVQLARGYVNRPGLTAERFVPDPFCVGERLYRTGDLAAWRPDGEIEYLGRIDDQVKIRGMRVEPGEVAAALTDQPEVRSAVVVADEGRLVAYLVTGAEGIDWRERLRARLPEHMIPSAYVPIEAIPTTPNGKLDHTALPTPDVHAADRTEYVAPRTTVEEDLCGIWERLLGRERVGVHDDFFELGGHSLLTVRLVIRVREELGVDLPVRRCFEEPTVAGQARLVEGLQRGAALEEIPRLEAGPAPLSFAQERLWFIDRLDPGNPVYNVAWGEELVGELDVEALAGAFDELVDRHAALRTVLPSRDGVPFQALGERRPRLAVQAVGDEEEARRIARAEARHRFDLAAGPLARARLLRLDDRRHHLLLTMHHVVTDRWSVTVLLRDLLALYEARLSRRTAALPELQVEYADFAAWQRGALTDDERERQLEYWRARLARMPDTLELPADRPRPAMTSYAGRRLTFGIDAELTARLRELARRENATLFMVMLAGFQALLSRYTGETDIPVGTPITGRPRSELEDLVGIFVNTLVLRGDLSGEPTFAELVRRARDTALDAYAHAEVPFEVLADELVEDRRLARNPLFQVMLAFQNVPTDRVRAAGLHLETLDIDPGVAQLDLQLFVEEYEDRLICLLHYSTDLFDADRIERLVEHLLVLLRAAVDDPGRRLSALPLLPGHERERLLEWNATDAEIAGASLHQLVAERAAACPDRTAVVGPDGSLSFGELERRAGCLAARLRELGVGRESRVAIFLPRGAGLFAALLAVLKAGGCYVPLAADYPAERLRYVLEDSGAELVLTDGALAARLPERRPATLILDERSFEGEPFAGVAAEPDRLAYVIYTSGSTGRPKGVMVTHRGVLNLIGHLLREPGLHADDASLCLASISFDLSVSEYFPPLVRGATVVIAGDGAVRDPARVGEAIRAGSVSAVHGTPSVLEAVLEELPAGLRWVLSGGEPLSPGLARRLSEAADELWNFYGPTETTVWSCRARVPDGTSAPPIGRPMANTRAYVLDDAMQLMPVGVPGELYLGGAGVARGYWGRPGLTAERFVPDPFGPPGGRLYRTGDVVRWRADGELEYVGRSDQQVKVRGMRIELGEVEAALSEHPAVRRAVVALRDDAPGGRGLVAYLDWAGEPGDVGELRGHLRDRLPAPMIPSAFVVVGEFPMAPGGKLDRAALPAPDGAGHGAGYVAARSAVERELCGIWERLLGRERVGVHDDFFELGGHSLLTVRLAAGIRDVLGVQLPVRRCYETPTVAGQALLVEELAAGAEPATPIPRRPADGSPAQLSFAQQRLWFIDGLDPGNPVYNVAWAERLEGSLEPRALSAAFDDLVDRHAALRTVFSSRDGEPFQAPGERRARLVIEEVGSEEEAGRIARAEARHRFDLAAGPLVRACLLRLGERDHRLLLTLHHAIADRWSVSLLLRDLLALYEARLEGRTAALPALPVSYADFAEWQRAAPLDDRELAYWRARLARLPDTLDLPADRPRPAVPSYEGRRLTFAIDGELTTGLRELARREDATLFMVLLAGLQALLARYTGETDIPVGTPISRRSHAELEDVVGIFLNTLVLRGDVGGDPTFAELVRRTRETALEAYAHAEVPFEVLVDELVEDRRLARNPLFQVMLALQNVPAAPAETAGVRLETLDVDPGVSQFDLQLFVEDYEDRLICVLHYSTDLFDHERIERLVEHFLVLLGGAVRDPASPVLGLPVLGAGEGERLARWNATEVAFPEASLQEQAAAAPDDLALIGRDRSLTFTELWGHVSGLAARLRTSGVGPDVVVGVLLERGVDLVVAVHGVVAAGGAYLPLEPDHPAERLAFMVRDAGAEVVVTSSSLADRVPAGVPAVCVDDVDAGDGSAPSEVASGSLAYVMFTSGSTGRPKGVGVSRAAIVNRLLWMQEAFGLDRSDRVLLKTPFSFDVSVWELFWPLMTGAGLVIAKPGGHRDSAYLAGLIAEHGVTTVHFVPSMLDVFADEPGVGSGLRRVICSGEALSAELCERFFARFPGVELHNLYGPTEAAVDVSWHACRRGARRVPIGRPIANTRLEVLDERLQPVPIGVRGELYLGGVQLARGYVNRPGLTAERFLPGPDGQRLYRTGDLAAWRPDGEVEYLGRIDDQVKVRGMRVEPGEVEAALVEQPEVRSAVVVADEGRLVAYLVTGAEGIDWRERLRARLPEHMLPSAYVPIETIPTTPNGKLDRARLPRPEAPAGAEYEAPESPAERAVADAWRSVLGVERVSLHDNFFALGGDSIRSLKVIATLRDAGYEVELQQLFLTQTVAELARGLRRAERGPEERPEAFSLLSEEDRARLTGGPR
jgi:amino acid adenylation domain-containing protein